LDDWPLGELLENLLGTCWRTAELVGDQLVEILLEVRLVCCKTGSLTDWLKLFWNPGSRAGNLANGLTGSLTNWLKTCWETHSLVGSLARLLARLLLGCKTVSKTASTAGGKPTYKP
jgi:hypothetical protein